MDAADRRILALLVDDGRRSFDDLGRHVSLSASAAKRRVDHEALGAATEALVELFYAPGTLLDEVAESLRRRPEVVEAWSVTGDADAIARVRTADNAALERLIMDLQRDGHVVRTRSQVIMSPLVSRT